MYEAYSEVVILFTLILLLSILANTIPTVIFSIEKSYSNIVLTMVSSYLEYIINYCYLEGILYSKNNIEYVMVIPSEVRIVSSNETSIIVFYKCLSHTLNFKFKVYAKAQGPIVIVEFTGNRVIVTSSKFN